MPAVIHAWLAHAGEGKAWTRCKKPEIVPLDEVTTDCLEVTCSNSTCASYARTQLQRRKAAMQVTW